MRRDLDRSFPGSDSGRVTSSTPSRLSALRKTHEDQVLSLLRRDGSASRADLARLTGLSRATLSEITANLLGARMIIVTDPPTEPSTRPGRVPEQLALHPSAGASIGVDFSHRHVTVAAVDAAHRTLGSRQSEHPSALEPADELELARQLITKVIDEHELDPASLAGIGIGVIGGRAARDPKVDQLRIALSEEFCVRVVVDNNTRLAGLAESIWGGAQGLSDVLYCSLGSGVGGAVIINGLIHRGPSGRAGEIGHVCIDPSGPPCHCGNDGCLESFVSVDALLAQASDSITSIEDLVAAADGGDGSAQRIFSLAGRRLGVALANACNVLDTPAVVVGGIGSRAGEHLMRPLRQALSRHVLAGSYPGMSVAVAALGTDAGALGAAVLVFRTVALSGRRTTQERQATS